MELAITLSGSCPQNISLKTKFLYIFSKKTCSEKVSYIFSKESFPYISGNESSEKISYNSESILKSSKNKKNSLSKSFLYFGKWNFLVPILINFFYFRGELVRPENQKLLILFLIKKQNFLN